MDYDKETRITDFDKTKTREEAIANLEIVVEQLKHNLTLLKAGVRPTNIEWFAASDPLSESLNYLLNNHDDLVSADALRADANGIEVDKTGWDEKLKAEVRVNKETGYIEVLEFKG